MPVTTPPIKSSAAAPAAAELRWPGEQVYRTLLRQLPVAAVACDAEGRIRFYNPAAARLWGRPPGVKDLQVLRGCEAQIERSDGSRRRVMPFSWPLPDASGRSVGAISLLLDVTELHERDLPVADQAEEQPRDGGNRFEAVADTTPDGVMIVSGDGTVDYINAAGAGLVGATVESIRGSRALDLVAPEYRSGWESAHHLILGGQKNVWQYEIATAGGGRRWVEAHGAPLRATGGSWVALTVIRDITERRRAEARDRERRIELERANANLLNEIRAREAGELAQARLAAIVESSDDAIVSKTLQGIITSWNRAAERLFGYAADEVIGRSILVIVPPERHAEESTILARLRAGERIEHFETRRVRKDGRAIDVALTVSPVRDSSGTIIGASKIARDITERKRMEDEREKLLDAERHAREEAQRVNRLKDEFLATLSHELRTPLNAILGWAHLLAEAKLPPSQSRQAGEVINRNARTQKQLIEDLLDMSRIVSGKLRLDVQWVDPRMVIESAMETIRPSAEAKAIRLEKILDPLAGPVSGDPARLQQVVWNLLSNAVKFTPAGGSIRLELRRANAHVELSVSDTGQGIKAEFLPYLFDRFRQADSSASRVYGGLGLGLAIVKQMVELHGGTVQAHSAGEGQGATFLIRLPLIPLRPHQRDEPQTHGRGAALPVEAYRVDLSRVRVLVVDDEADARELIKRLLQECNAEVFTAESAAAAMSVLEESRPDVLISDIGMPQTDGYQFLRDVRGAGGAASRIPAIALTALARSEDRTRALRAGYIAHVAKPVEPSELIATVAVIAGRHG